MESGAVFFDVDGVLIDSLAAKGEVFASLFPAEYRKDVMKFHLANGGLNRVEKIERISREIVGVDLSDNELSALVDAFSSAVREGVLAADEIPGATPALAAVSKRVPIHAVSAVPTSEVTEVLQHHSMLHFFTSVHGAPTPKAAIIVSLTQQHNYLPSQCLFVGDSLHDRDAAFKAGIPFIFVQSGEQSAPPEAVCVIDDLRGLDSRVAELMTGG
jgi:phosphoglycolate phosphatase